MAYFKTPQFLHEVFGEKQSMLEVSCTVLFALVGSWLVYFVADIKLDNWQVILAFILIADVLAGCIANFSLGRAIDGVPLLHLIAFIAGGVFWLSRGGTSRWSNR